MIIIYIILSLPIGSPLNGPDPVKVSYPYDFEVETLDFSPDGKFLATGYEEGYVRIWNVVDGEQINVPEDVIEKERLMKTLGSHDITHVISVKFFPDGKYVLSGGYLSGFEDYDNKFNERNEVEQIDVSEVNLWSIDAGNCIRTHYLENNDVESVAFSTDGSSYAASYQNDHSKGTTTIYIWSTKTGEILNSITSDVYQVQSLTYSPDGRYLVVSYSGSPRIIFWDLENMSTERIISTPFIIRDLDFSDDGRIFAGISDRTGHIIIWDTATGEVQRTFYALHGLFANMDLSPSGDYVAGIRSSRMAIWNVSSGKKILDISSLPKNEGVNRFTCLKFSPETKYLATGIRIPTTAPYYFSPDEFSRARRGNVNVDLLLSIGGTNPIFLWNFQDIEDGEYIESLWDVQHDFPLFWVIVLWAPLIAVSYFGLLVIYGIFRVRKTK